MREAQGDQAREGDREIKTRPIPHAERIAMFERSLRDRVAFSHFRQPEGTGG